MKTRLLLLPALFTFCMIPCCLHAYDAEVNGIFYSINATDLTATVAKGTYQGNINIPANINYSGRVIPVVGVDRAAFKDCTNLTSVSFANSIRSLSPNAFSGCTNLKEVKLPDSLSSIDYNCFSDCKNLKKIDIPQKVTSIGDFAFYGCTSLGPDYTVPTNITRLGMSVWFGCTGIKRLIFADTNQGLSPEGFYSMYSNPYTGLYPETIYVGRTVVGFSSNDNSKFVEFGKNLKSWGNSSFVGDSTKTIVSDIEEPSQISDPTFSNYVYLHCVLYVPKGKVDIYKNANGWKPFFNIVENDKDISGISKIKEGSRTIQIEGYYNTSGQQVDSNAKGLIIVKYSDGTSKKIFK